MLINHTPEGTNYFYDMYKRVEVLSYAVNRAVLEPKTNCLQTEMAYSQGYLTFPSPT